jgi:hypothetical protein
VMCKSNFVISRDRLLVGPVGPVVLHRIWCEQAVPAGGTSGTGVRRTARADWQSFMGGPTGPTHWSHQKSAERPAVPPVPPVPPVARCPVSGMKNAFNQ